MNNNRILHNISHYHFTIISFATAFLLSRFLMPPCCCADAFRDADAALPLRWCLFSCCYDAYYFATPNVYYHDATLIDIFFMPFMMLTMPCRWCHAAYAAWCRLMLDDYCLSADKMPSFHFTLSFRFHFRFSPVSIFSSPFSSFFIFFFLSLLRHLMPLVLTHY